MSENIVGPFGSGVQETTVRPTDTGPADGAADTWFRDCTTATSDDGTSIPALWLNKMTALMRRAIRGRNVTQTPTDDDMLLKAINSADRAVVNLGDAGSGLYAGLDVSGRHQVRKVKAGANITLTTNAGGEVEIASAPPAGGGSLGNVGSGQAVYNGLNGSTHEFKRIKSGGGCTIDTDADAVRITVPGATTIPAGARVLVGDTLTTNPTDYDTASALVTTAFSGSHTPEASGNTLFLDAVIDIRRLDGDGEFDTRWYLEITIDASTDGGSTFAPVSTTKRVNGTVGSAVINNNDQAVVTAKITTGASPVQYRCRVQKTIGGAVRVLAGSRIRVMEYKQIA